MPAAARQAKELAHHRAGHTGTCNSQKQTGNRDYRLTAEYRQYRADETEYREERNNSRRDEIRALAARTYLHTQRTPRLIASRAKLVGMKKTTDKARIARARSPERVRAAMVRHMNTVTHSILKERGFRK